MIAYWAHNLSPFVFEIGDGIGLRWYGLSYAAGFLAGWWLYRWLARRGLSPLRPEQVADFITWGAVFGVLLGGRLGYALFYDLPACMADPARIFRVWEGGMASHGGMIGLILYTLWFARRHKVSWTGIGDNLCVVAPVGLFFGRIANFINGELYGRPSDVPWAILFPGAPEPRHPSQLYEAFLEGAVLFGLLWFVRTRLRVPRGVLTGMFFVFYALLRIAGEWFREPDPAWAVGGLSAGQFLSVFLIAIGAAFWANAYRNPTYEAALAAPTAPRGK
jgi:phosphatidylglycerol:prolipoprotein diacylglycerol transferase